MKQPGRVALGELEEGFDVDLDPFEAQDAKVAVLGGDAEAVTLQPEALAIDGAVLLLGVEGGPSTAEESDQETWQRRTP